MTDNTRPEGGTSAGHAVVPDASLFVEGGEASNALRSGDTASSDPGVVHPDDPTARVDADMGESAPNDVSTRDDDASLSSDEAERAEPDGDDADTVDGFDAWSVEDLARDLRKAIRTRDRLKAELRSEREDMSKAKSVIQKLTKTISEYREAGRAEAREKIIDGIAARFGAERERVELVLVKAEAGGFKTPDQATPDAIEATWEQVRTLAPPGLFQRGGWPALSPGVNFDTKPLNELPTGYTGPSSGTGHLV